jgi:hypothetical protein
MDRRPNLQTLLETVLGSRNVYFQPPSSVHIKYPAIIYSRANIENLHANNRVYLSNIAYQLTVVDRDPDSEIVDKVSQLPKCSFNRHYVADNLHHDVFTIYF